MKKPEIIVASTEKDIKLTGKRKILYQKMSGLYPKGNPIAQIKFCKDLHEDRIDHYINSVFSRP